MSKCKRLENYPKPSAVTQFGNYSMGDKTETSDGELCRRCGRSRDDEVHTSSYGQGCLYTANLAEALADKLFSWCAYGTKEYAQWSDALRTDMEKAAHELRRLSALQPEPCKEPVHHYRCACGSRSQTTFR